ncbi:heparinase II/III family protein [Cellulomonas marina]|uniref:Heparinase II/III-like protein n=1 Tax=Cellulomonas marina TaxID=988821 RepID=A0A1I1AK72_9CELL|nr:heparinase II/III family protein [Cellulomonas marina]GIG30165.1 heparinase [Cellulomonas marina]SFB38409.1 Heparinase II/III-like protein [Cellulomonas marina]
MTATTDAPGPLLRTWGAAAGPAALRVALRPPADALPLLPAARRDVWGAGADAAAPAAAPAADGATLRAVVDRATRERGTPWPQPTASGFARYARDGDRVGYEAAVFERQRRLTRAVVAAAVTLDDAWLDEVVDGTVGLCEQSSWCWPAHDDTRARHGAFLPTVTDPFLDLGAGEVAAQLAWTVHLLGPELEARTPGLLARVRHEVRARVLTPYRTRRDWHWLGLDGDVHNWNPWILGDVVTAALVLEDDEHVRAEVVAAALVDVDRYAASLPADGAVDEGFGYWWNGAARLLELLEVVEHATGGALDPAGIPPLAEVVAFPHRMHLGGPWYLNLADGPARPGDDLPWQVLHRWGRRLGVPEAVAHAAAHRRPGAPAADEVPGLGRLLRAVTDPAWCGAVPGASPLVRDVWLPSTQVLLARPAADDSRVVLAVKGGHNGEHHNHDDVGSVVVALGGVPVLVDPGRPTYTAVTFGPDRYTLWPMQSGWHDVPVVRGHEQGHGAQHAARDVRARLDDRVAELSLDLAAAYPPAAGVGTWRRTARLDRATGAVTVREEWSDLAAATGAAGPTRLHWVVAGEVAALGPGRAELVGLAGAAIVLTWDAAAAHPDVEDRPLDDPLLVDVWGDRLRRLSLTLVEPAASGSFTLHLEVPA